MVQAILNLPDKVGVTARLSLNYKAPTIADQVCMPLRCIIFSDLTPTRL